MNDFPNHEKVEWNGFSLNLYLGDWSHWTFPHPRSRPKRERGHHPPSSLSGDGVEDVLEADVPLADGERPAPRVHHARHPAAARWRGGAGGGVGAAEAEEAADVAVHRHAQLVGRRPARGGGPPLPENEGECISEAIKHVK